MKKFKNVKIKGCEMQYLIVIVYSCLVWLFCIVFMSKSGKYCRVPELLRLESDGNLGGSEVQFDNNNLNESPSNRFPETIN